MDAGGVRGSGFGRLPGVRPATRSHASPSVSSRRMVEAAAPPGAVDPDPPRQQEPPEDASPKDRDEASVVLQAVDAHTGRVLWQIPGDSLPALSQEIVRAAASAGPASFSGGHAQPSAADSVDHRLGARAYGADDHPVPPPGRVSRTI